MQILVWDGFKDVKYTTTKPMRVKGESMFSAVLLFEPDMLPTIYVVANGYVGTDDALHGYNAVIYTAEESANVDFNQRY